jgi:hypothetical protein
MKSNDFVNKLIDIATNYKTLYVMGSFGSPMTEERKNYMFNHHPYNRLKGPMECIKKASSDTFGFDCVCLIKGVLWGWNGNKNASHGGAVYASNGVPDVNADGMIGLCDNLSSNFTNIIPGEAVWMPGHIGVYIGDGLCVECTPDWKNCVQITSCNCTKSGYNRRNWKKHGKLPFITYEKALESGSDIIKALISKYGVEINEVARAVKAVDKAKTDSNYLSLYWILHKLVNENGK